MMPETTAYGYDLADRLTGVVGPGPMATFYRLGGDGSRIGEKTVANWVGLASAPYDSVTAASESRYAFDSQGGLAGIVDAATGASLATFVTDRAGRVTSEQRAGLARTLAVGWGRQAC